MDVQRMKGVVTKTCDALPQGAECANLPSWVRRSLVGAGLTVGLMASSCCLTSSKPVYAGPPQEEPPPSRSGSTMTPNGGVKPDEPVDGANKKVTPERPMPPRDRPLYGIPSGE